MKEETYDGSAERDILIGMITSAEVLSRLSPRWEKEPLRSKWSNLIADWCVQHYRKHAAAPLAAIVSYFAKWTKTNNEPDTKKLLERFLSQLSKRYEALAEEIQVSHVVEQTQNLLNEVRLERQAEDIQNRLQRGDVSGALQVAESFRKVSISGPEFTDIFRDKEAQKQALEHKQRVLIRYKGPIGDFFGDDLAEDCFVGFLAPPKSAKSFFMLDLAWKAMQQKRKVAYFQVGDLTKHQIMRRFQARAARRPIKAGLVLMPAGLIAAPDGKSAQVEFKDTVYENDLTVEEGQKAFQGIASRHKSQRFRLSYHPSKTIGVNDIKNTLADWERDGFAAQVIICDYADNLLSSDKKLQRDEQTEETWTLLRQISEVRKCLVVTATQVNAEGFGSWIMTKRNFSRSKMIMAVVSSFIGINQTPEERGKGLFRLNYLVRREAAFSEYRCCTVASCLALSQAVCLSSYEV